MSDRATRRGETVILAAGDFPKKGGQARQLLDAARRVVCCDGAADTYRRRTGRAPTVVVGDLDSVSAAARARAVRIAEQETNDLAKAVRWCAAQGWTRPLLLGVTGRREDHTLGNIFRALELGLEIVTDHGRFEPLHGRKTFAVRAGTPVSIFAVDPATRMTSRGLVWPLDGVTFTNLYCATLNRTAGTRLTLTATRPVYVYFPF